MSDRLVRPHPGVPVGWLRASHWTIGESVAVRALQAADMDSLRHWRNEQQSVLRQQVAISAEHQHHWFEHVVEPSHEQPCPSALLVVVERNGSPCSYGGLTNIDWVSRRAEVSFLAATEIAQDEVQYAMNFALFLSWLADVTFDELEFHRIFTETWDFRSHHISILEAAGFRSEGRLRDHVAKDGRLHDAVLHGMIDTDRKAEK